MDEVTKLYNSVSVAGVPTREPTLSELTRLKFGLIQIKERNTDYTHFEVATIRHISSTLHQIAASIRTKITFALKIQIFQYFMSVKEHVESPHYGGKDVIFLLQRSQSYDCIKRISRKSEVVQFLSKECAVTVKHLFEVRCHSTVLLDWFMDVRN